MLIGTSNFCGSKILFYSNFFAQLSATTHIIIVKYDYITISAIKYVRIMLEPHSAVSLTTSINIINTSASLSQAYYTYDK